MVKRFSNKNELQQQLLQIYDKFKSGNISNRQAKRANQIIKILKYIDLENELKQYIFKTRLKSKMFVNACKPSMKCHLKYAFNYPQGYKARTKKIEEVAEKLEAVLLDDFNQEVKSDTEKSKLKNLSNVMVKNETFAKLKNLY